MASSKLQAFWNHPAGPKTIHFWAPTFKWGISIANIADFAKPPEKISYPQQVGMYKIPTQWDPCISDYMAISLQCIACFFFFIWCAAVACTGIIWSRYSMVITPKNWNLFSVNVAMAGTGLYQLSRKIRQDYFSDEKDAAAPLEG
ncbi:mitochondrial pyruvate carrier 4 isoform X1 [Phragmites australis]|uniref:mitochondrial pyruvate carrier 4 isoform X1 n=1 Tax=Phragmites australis TaxID=29695 RepID=UPI002D797D9F|nr:mitochondrial pyruvate carrier 4 isoform X1 [Phragmites australis]XP_062196589.1 mitochondrial pyruvate carrier 4 isoform X1 [Phragmites australis]